jgi:hypothetical protein
MIAYRVANHLRHSKLRAPPQSGTGMKIGHCNSLCNQRMFCEGITVNFVVHPAIDVALTFSGEL